MTIITIFSFGGTQCFYERVNWPANFKRLDHPPVDHKKIQNPILY